MTEPLKATFFALRRRDRLVLLPASVVYAAIVALLVAAFVALNWGTLTHFFTLVGRPPEGELSETDAMRVFSGMMGLFGAAILFLIPFYIVTASYEAACLRWMIRGETPGVFGLTFDHDTWRVYGVYWVWFLTQMIVGFAMSMLMMPIMFVLMGDLAGPGAPDPDSAAMLELQLKMQALSMVQYIPLAFIGIRFGPAAATSIVRKRFSFFEAWNATDGRFLALLGSYAVLWLLFGVAYAALYGAIYGTLFGPLFAEYFAAWPNPPTGDWGERFLASLRAPSSWALIGVGYAGAMALTLCYVVLSYGVNARTALAALGEGKIQAE